MSFHAPAPASRRPSPALAALPLALAVLAASCGSDEAPPGEPAGGAPATGGTTTTPQQLAPPPNFAGEVDPDWFDDPPAERAPVDGIEGFHAVSALEYTAAPGHPHRFDVVHVFPDRARWSIGLPSQPDAGYILEYRYGGHRYRKMPGWPGSTEMTGLSLAAGLRQIELRLAAMMYPHAQDWGPEEVLEGETVRSVELGGEAGSIRVTLGADDRPARFTAIGPDGKEYESLVVDSWQEVEGRTWPRELHLEGEGQVVSREIVNDVTTRLTMKDQYFIPVDFKELPEVRRDFDDQPRITPLPPMTIRTEALPPGTTWPAAIAAAAERRAEWSADGTQFDEFASFGIDESAAPRNFFVRLAPGAPPTEGYSSRPQRRAVTLFTRSIEAVGPEHVAALRAALPEGANAHDLYLSWPTNVDSTRVQLVLPFDL